MASALIDIQGHADSDAAVGAAVRAALGDRCPWLAVQTSFSALHGTVSPERWGRALAACASDHAAPWAALADVGDLAGLPACLDVWDRRVAVGATLALSDHAQRRCPPVLVLAPDVAAYRRLCRLLSWHHEDVAGWQAWLAGRSETSPAWDGVIAVVQDADWAERLAWHGADVHWRLPGPSAPAGVPSVAVPILTDIDGSGTRAAALLHLIQDRSQVRAQVEAVRGRSAFCALADVPQMMRDISDVAIAGGHALARRCRYAPGAHGANGQPQWQMPPSHWQDSARELRRCCLEGLHQRYGGTTPMGVKERLEYELGVITRKNFASYILTVAGITKGRRTCGRGSAASSLVCYVLGITNVDPVKYRLVFERFLSDERTDPPDIDVDFPWDERDDVLAAVMSTYGHEHVAMVATHQTLRKDGALRDAGRALGRDRAAITAAAKRVDLVERFGAGEGAGSAWADVVSSANSIEGLMRGFGLHCGGVIITTDPIRDLVPVHPAAKMVHGRPLPAIAWEKDGAEAMGLVKLDLLGNRSLAVVRDVFDDLQADGVAIDVWRWAPDRDLLTNQLIARGQTIGCFYIESPAMRQLIARCGRIDFDQLVLLSSIIRPAAQQWISTYLDRLHAFRRTGEQQESWYPHPALRGLLSQSFGILSYQEDVMLSARDLAGFGIREQNTLRKSLGRSDTPQRLASLASAFRDGCQERGVTAEVIEQVWANIISFAGYSFCKAHSASYAMVSYACACLKAHNPAHFMARVIHNQGGFYGISAYVEEARRLGAEILPPCVVRGFPDTRGVDRGAAVRLGFELVKGLHRRTQQAIVRERGRMPFAGIRDFWQRCRPTSAECLALHDAGAFHTLLSTFTAAERDWLVITTTREPRGDSDDDDQLRFDFAPTPSADPLPPADLLPVTLIDLDRRAWNMLGCLPRTHPFALWDLPQRRLFCRDIGPQCAKRTLALLVWVITRKQVEAVQERARDGAPLPEPVVSAMAFVTLEDDTGTLESVWFPEVYRACGPLIESGRPFWVQGKGSLDHGVISLEVVKAWLP